MSTNLSDRSTGKIWELNFQETTVAKPSFLFHPRSSEDKGTVLVIVLKVAFREGTYK